MLGPSRRISRHTNAAPEALLRTDRRSKILVHGRRGQVVGHGPQTASSDPCCFLAYEADLNPVREWKTGKDGSDLSYCGCDLKITEAGGYKIERATCMKKVKPITLDKRRDPSEVASEKDVSQLRGFFEILAVAIGAIKSTPSRQHLDPERMRLKSHHSDADGLQRRRTPTSAWSVTTLAQCRI